MSQQETTVEQLISIIQVIQRSRMSGTLMAKRGNGATYEEGVITFVNGHPAEARFGRRKGLDVFNWLSTWSACSYQFIAPKESTQPITPIPLTTDSLADASVRLEQVPTERQIRSANELRSSFVQVLEKEITGSLAHIRSYFVKQEADYGLISEPITQKSPVVHSEPYRTRQSEEALRIIENKGLSRLHRHLFLLVDGERSASELARVLKRPEDVVNDLLGDLEEVALVKLPTPSTS